MKTRFGKVCNKHPELNGERAMWYLQLNPDGIAFWDSYIHKDCSVVEKREGQPFKRMLYTPGLCAENERLLRDAAKMNMSKGNRYG